MRRFALCLLVLGLSVTGCTSSDSGGESIGDLEWPPKATVYFDQYRVFNADCATDEDCAMALGYYHAFDRFVQMDIRRRFSTGRLADILLPGLAAGFVDGFKDLRALFSTREGQPAEQFLYEQSSPKTKALLDAYAVGVNQWIADVRSGNNGATFPREFTHVFFDYGPEDIPAWTPQDSVAAVLALIESLTNDESAQVNAGNAREAIGNDLKFSDLWSRRPLEESSILPTDWQPPPPPDASEKSRNALAFARPKLRDRLNIAPVLRQLQDKLERTLDLRQMILGPGDRGVEIGSNNWVVGPSLTTAGNALLSNDPHLGMSQPATWYLAHIDATTNGNGQIHAAGSTFAGLPWVIVGQNASIAWGLTTTLMDFSDVYIETLAKDGEGNPTGVMFNGEEVPFTRVPFTITFSDGSTQEEELLFVPHHGAVRSIDADNNTAITLRWTGSDVDTDINFLTELVKSTTVAEARVALENITSIGQNVVVIDSENNIGWFPYNRLPKRTWATNLAGDAPPWLPLDGSGVYEWDDYFALEELPQALNPESGYIATANNDMTGSLFDGDPTTLPNGDPHPPYQVEAAAGFRHSRIVDLIEDVGDQHTRQTMDQIVSDVHSLIGERMRPGLLAIAKDDQTTPGLDGAKVISALEGWDFTCPTGLDGTDSDNSPLSSDSERTPGGLRVHWRSTHCSSNFAPASRTRRTHRKAEHPASRCTIRSWIRVSSWQGTCTGTIRARRCRRSRPSMRSCQTSLQAAGDFLSAQLGPDETQWAWGRLHGLLLGSDLSTFEIYDYDNPAPGDPLFANDGGLFTVDVANPGTDNFVQTAGPSTRFVCEASTNGPTCTIQLPGGQSGDINSPHYEDLLFPYLANEPMPLVFDIEEAEANAEDTINFE